MELPLSLKSSTSTISAISSGGERFRTLCTVLSSDDHPSLWNGIITLVLGSFSRYSLLLQLERGMNTVISLSSTHGTLLLLQQLKGKLLCELQRNEYETFSLYYPRGISILWQTLVSSCPLANLSVDLGAGRRVRKVIYCTVNTHIHTFHL